jgi:hypothetical protein
MTCGESGRTVGSKLCDGNSDDDDDDDGDVCSNYYYHYFYLLTSSNVVSVNELRPVTSTAHCVTTLAIHHERRCSLQSMR